MTETIEVNGTFWLPGKSDKLIHGRLKYSPDAISLNLSGDLEDPFFIGRDEFGAIPCVHGLLEKGGRCTLLRLVVLGRKYGTSIVSKCTASFLIIGEHTEDLDKLRIQQMSVDVIHLTSFAAVQWLDVEDKRGLEGAFEGVEVRCKQSPKRPFHVQSIGATLTIRPILLQAFARTTVTVTATETLDIKPDEPQSLEWFLNILSKFCNLLSLVADEHASPTQLRFGLTGKRSVGLILYQAVSPSDAAEDALSLLFTLADLESQFPVILDTWFAFGETMTEAVDLYMEARHRKGASIHRRFAMMAESLEAFSRAATNAEYMAKEEYQKVINALNDAMPATVIDGHKASLKNRIKFGNEYSLRKRLDLLLDSLTPAGRDLVCRSSDNFATGFTETRHYFAHRTDELRPKALDGADLYWASEKVLLLLRLLLLKHLGLSDDTIVAAIAKHPRLQQIKALSEKHKETP